MIADVYRRVAASYRHEGGVQVRSLPGRRALLAALEILEQQPISDSESLARVLLEMGDMRTAGITNASDRDGHEYYLRAWDALAPLGNRDELQRDWFAPEFATFVISFPLSSDGLSSSATAEQGSVVIKFDVDDRGLPGNARVVSSNPPGFKDFAAMRALRGSKFRPRMENREFIPAQGLSVEYAFTYLPEDID
jgi:TonB family protein